jgi:hypothetical protein
MRIFFSDNLFRAALYRLMLVLHKDALFHLTRPRVRFKTLHFPGNILIGLVS